MTPIIDCKPGEFYELSGLFFVPAMLVPAGQSIELGDPLPGRCMFDIWNATCGGEWAGYVLRPHFEVINAGTYLLTRLRSKGQATEVDVILKSDVLVVYNYPNVGTLAISPLVNKEIETILVEQ